MQLVPGQAINQYTLDRCLGHGASGEVWAASLNGQLVAMKIIHEQYTNDSKQLLYLKNEIKILSKLNHPHIPKLHDCDVSFERPYLVMEYVNSPSIESLIASGNILSVPMKKRMHALFTLAHTITAIHKAGFIHRDIKPASINGINHPYILDFGIALSLNNAKNAHPDVGTGVYMPPSHIPPSPHSDFYGFALVAYELLFGCHPIFELNESRTSVQETRQIAGNRIKDRQWRFPGQLPLEALPGDLHGADVGQLDVVFEQALNTDYDDIGQFIHDLDLAIFNPDNLPYLENPSPLFTIKPIPLEKQYTDREVKRGAVDTDLAAHTKKNTAQLVAAFLFVSIIAISAILLLAS